MTIRRNAGAPRLIDWTGERCVPWAPDVQVVYEHLHRYLWAARLVEGRRVLDLASGEGFGAALLAGSATSVVGIDVDERTVDHSRLNYGNGRLEFRLGDARDLSMFEDGSFGVVVAFEMIEHIEEQARVVDEIARVLEPGGLLIISTPERRAYSDADGIDNPFHVRELARDELKTLLERRFAHTATLGQRPITGSAVSALGQFTETTAEAESTFFVEREGDEWRIAPGLSPLYLVALASNADLPPVPRHSTLADCGLQLLRAAEAALGQAAGQRVQLVHEELQRTQDQFQALTAEQARLLGDHAHTLAELQRAIRDRDTEITLRRERAAEHEYAIEYLRTEVAGLQQFSVRVQQSVSWQLLQAARRRLYAALGGEGSALTRAIQRVLRGVGRLISAKRKATRSHQAQLQSEGQLIAFPECEDPEVSIVIPLYSGAELTQACLESIRAHTFAAYEVILVDDAADPATKQLLKAVRGAQVLVNRSNIGYLRSVNRGASRARGSWLVLCNNDIEVRDGWLSEMRACGQSSSDIAVVTPKYLYPDGSLNEAGGIIWRDGGGGNYGRGESPGDCRYEFRRDVDYGSAAALMVRADFWREVGGFDERFEPMYYEDTDLCFRARERGLRVVYEPRANVVHVEGGTAGTDVSGGHKRFQEINRKKFVDKWRSSLEREQLRPLKQNARRASNRHRGPHVLIVDHRVPMWDRDSGSLRMRGMIRALIELGCRVTFFPDDRQLLLPYTIELQRMGVEVWYGDIDIAAELAAIGPGLALVITSRPHTTSRWLDLIRGCAPSVPIAYDTVDLHWLREARRVAAQAGSDQTALGPRAAVLREIEMALIRASDTTLVVTEEERAQVEADVPGAVVQVVPNVNEVRMDVPPVDGRAGVLFIGGFEHTPNTDAVLRLVERVMPRVWRELGHIPVTIVGGSAPPEIEALASSVVDVTGWVRDIDPVLDAARAMVAPITYGAGLKGKVTQALAAGLPVVTTSTGAEGLDAADGEPLLIGESDSELAERVIRVLTDDELWARLSSAGQQTAAERWSPRVMAERLGSLLTTAEHGVSRRAHTSIAAGQR